MSTRQIYSKLAMKTPEQHVVLLLLTFNIFHTFFTVNIAEFAQKNVDWVWEMVVSDNVFSVTERNILSYGLGKLI